jgi:protein TonB
MKLQKSNNRFLAITILCSVLLHVVGLWFLGSIAQTIRIDIAGQKHINVRLAAAPATPQASPENTRSTAHAKAQPKKELKKEPSKEKPAKPLKQTAETAQVQKQVTKAPEAKAPEPVKQTQPENQKAVQETASVVQASERKSEIPLAVGSAESESAPPPVSAIPRYQLGSAANPEPDYPMLARNNGWQGDVILGVHLEADGSIKHLTFVKSTDYGILNHAAYETVRTQWRFDPIEGETTLANSYIEVPISFRFD